MLPKKNRADKKLIQEIFKSGRFFNSESLSFKFLKIPQQEKRISFIVPKSVSRLAIKRNELRRLGYLALEELFEGFPVGVVGVFIFKKPQENVSKVKDEIKKIFNKIN